jgi:hypothetical protein
MHIRDQWVDICNVRGKIALAWHHGRILGGRLATGRAVLLSPTRLAFWTAGSGSCPWLPTNLDIVGSDEVRMDLAVYNPDKGPCSTDFSTTTVVVTVDPARVDVRHDLSIRLVYAPDGAHTVLLAAGLG